MKPFFYGLAAFLTLMISGCATGIDAYDQHPVSNNEAVVLVGVDSKIEISEAQYCDTFCLSSYPFRGSKEIMAFPVNVGSIFKLNSVTSMDNRVARLNGGSLKIQERGIYYYGTIYSTDSEAGILNTPNSDLLLAAKRKYGTRFDDLKAINFTWPDTSGDHNYDVEYQDSPKVQEMLHAYAGKHMQLAMVSPPAHFDESCRGGGKVALPNFLPYEEYVRRAFNHELHSAGIYDGNPDAPQLTGAITDLSFSTMGNSSWKMGLRITNRSGHAAAADVNVPFEGSWQEVSVCSSAEHAVPNTVRKLIEDLVASPGFKAVMTETSGFEAHR